MSPRQSRASSYDRGRHHTKARKRAKRKRMDMIQLQQMVFELSPAALVDALDGLRDDDIELDAAAEEQELADELVDLESDMDIYDEDTESVHDVNQSWIDAYTGLINQSVAFQDPPTLMPATKYIITIAQLADGTMRCRFEPPFEFTGRMPKGAGQAIIPKLVSFIETIAVWMEDKKQAFLKQPSAQTFAAEESAQSNDPIVMQKGFLARINAALPQNHQVSLPNFSRMLDNVWMVWPLFNMPLKALFSPAFKRAWLIEICATIYGQAPEVWRQQLNNPQLTRADLKAIKKRPYDSLNPDEKFHLLRDSVKIPSASAQGIWHDAVSRLKRKTHGEEDN